MWRTAGLLVLVIALSVAVAWLANHAGHVVATWTGNEGTGYEVRMNMLTALAVLAGGMLAAGFAWRLLAVLFAGPGRIAARLAARRLRQAEAILARGLIAVAAGDAVLARRLAARIETAMKEGWIADHLQGVAGLFQVQAAQINNDREEANRQCRALLDEPETVLAGLRGLTMEALRSGNRSDALAWAQEALKRQPKTLWAAQAAFEMQAAAGNWKEAEQTLDEAVHHSLFDRPDALRRRAVLLTARALEQADADAPANALAMAMEAVKLAPDLIPAATLAGRLLNATGRSRQAEKILTGARRALSHSGPFGASESSRREDGASSPSPQDLSSSTACWICNQCACHAEDWRAVCPQCSCFDSLSWQTAADNSRRNTMSGMSGNTMSGNTMRNGSRPDTTAMKSSPDSGFADLPRQPDDPGPAVETNPEDNDPSAFPPSSADERGLPVAKTGTGRL